METIGDYFKGCKDSDILDRITDEELVRAAVRDSHNGWTTELETACMAAVNEHPAFEFHGRKTLADLCSRAMAILKKTGAPNPPKCWLTIIKSLRQRPGATAAQAAALAALSPCERLLGYKSTYEYDKAQEAEIRAAFADEIAEYEKRNGKPWHYYRDRQRWK